MTAVINFWLGHENTATAKSPFCFQSIPFTSFDRQPPLYKTTTEPALGNRCPINPNLREHFTLLFPRHRFAHPSTNTHPPNYPAWARHPDIKMSLSNCRFYEEKYPEIDSFVMVNVKQVRIPLRGGVAG